MKKVEPNKCVFARPKFTQATHSAGVNFHKRNSISTTTQILLDTRKYCRQAFNSAFVQLTHETKMSTKQTRIKQEHTRQLTALRAVLSCLSCAIYLFGREEGRQAGWKSNWQLLAKPGICGKGQSKEIFANQFNPMTD